MSMYKGDNKKNSDQTVTMSIFLPDSYPFVLFPPGSNSSLDKNGRQVPRGQCSKCKKYILRGLNIFQNIVKIEILAQINIILDIKHCKDYSTGFNLLPLLKVKEKFFVIVISHLPLYFSKTQEQLKRSIQVYS